jgi:sugar/nucleoside kinase (ribokinase family)
VRPPRGVFVGLTTIDIIHRLNGLPAADAKLTASAQEVLAGGPAAVAAITFAALGGSAVLVTALGGHPLAAVARHDLTAHRVTVLDSFPAGEHGPGEWPIPPVSAVRVDLTTGTRSVSSADATVPQLAGAPAPAALAGYAEAADVVVLDGHYPRLALPAAEIAQAAAVPVLLDAGRWRAVFADLLPKTDAVIASAAFAVPANVSMPARSARSHGGADLEWRDGDVRGSVDIVAVEGADTLGAGDALHGAAAFAIGADHAAGVPSRWPDVLRFAGDVATFRVGRVGARTWLAEPAIRRWGTEWMAASHASSG